jgi:hypothetical protein
MNLVNPKAAILLERHRTIFTDSSQTWKLLQVYPTATIETLRNLMASNGIDHTSFPLLSSEYKNIMTVR